MLLKEFSHILNNTRLVIKKVINEQAASTSVNIENISSNVDSVFCKSVNELIAEASDETNETQSNAEDISNIIKNSDEHFLTPFDQTQIQTQIMSKYIQVLCYKYGIDETEMEIDVNPIQKNNHLWLAYTCKFPKLHSNDGLKVEEFINYVDRNGEYHVKGRVVSEIGSKIKIYISTSNEIGSAQEFNAAIRTGAYTLAKEDGYYSGEVFDILVKYGCSVLFRGDYCNDVILLSIQYDVAIDKITLAYNNSLQGSKTLTHIKTEGQIVSTNGQESANYNYNTNTYWQLNPRLLELYVDSISEEAYSLFCNNKLQVVLLEATSDKEKNIDDNTPKTWSVVDRNYLVFNTAALQQVDGVISIINQKNISTLLDSIGMKESLYNESRDHTNVQNYNSSFYLKCGLRNSETGEILSNVDSNICVVSCQWKNQDATGSYNDAGGNKIIFEITNTPDEGKIRPAIPEMMALAYIYTGSNDKVVPNFIIPNIEKNYNYYSTDTWKAYNVYCDPSLNTRSNCCLDGIVSEQGKFNSGNVSVSIEFVSYYIDSNTPTIYYTQTLSLTDNFSYELSNTIITDKDRFDVQHQILTIHDIPVNTPIHIKSTVNRYVYKKDENGKSLVKDEYGNYNTNGELDNYDTNTTTYKTGRIVYLQDNSNEDNIISEVQYYIAESVNNNTYVLTFEDEDSNIITKSEASTEQLYSSVPCDLCHFIKKLNSNGKVAVQNIFPKGIHHFGIYSKTNNTRVGYVNLSESTLRDTDNSNILLKLGFLSDVHHELNPTINASSEDFANAVQFFTNKNVNDIYIAGDLTVRDSHYDYNDLQAFKDNLDTVRSSIQNVANIYIVRGNHDIGCLGGHSGDPHNFNDDSNIYDIEDEKELYRLDEQWVTYLQDDLCWQEGYYFPGLITENEGSQGEIGTQGHDGTQGFNSNIGEDTNTGGTSNNVINDDPQIGDIPINPFIPNENVLGEGEQFIYDVSTALKTCGYNVYNLQEGDDELHLVVIGLPLYFGGFWSWGGNSQKPAYTNEQLYQLELVIRKYYNQPNTEIIIITHLPFVNNLTGNYKSVYSRNNGSSMGMDGWYNQQQYRALEQLHDTYKGVIWVEGHTHYKYEIQGLKSFISFFDSNSNYQSAGGNTNIEGYFDNANISCYKDVFDVHIASCAYPRWIENNSSKDMRSESQGSLFEVHSKFIDIKGINFKDTNDTDYTNMFIPVGMYRLYFLENKPEMQDETVLIYNHEDNSLYIRPNENL